MIKTALIGCGRIGFLLEKDPLRYKPCTHFGGAKKAGIKITCACDTNNNRLQEFGKTAKIKARNLYINHLELLKNQKPDIVIIATWTNTHFEIAKDAIQHGAKIVVLEKPVASNIQYSKTLIDEAKKNNCKIIINHERRYDNRYRKVKSLIDNNKIGSIKTIHGYMLTRGFIGTSDISLGGGPLLHDGTHLIDIIQYFIGNFTSVKGKFYKENNYSGFEDKAIGWFTTESNIDVIVEAGGNRDFFHFEIDISGTDGRIIIGNGFEKLFLKKESKYYTGFKDLHSVLFPKFTKNNCFHELYKEVKKILKDSKYNITSSINDGHNALEAIHATYLSSYKKSEEIKLPLQKNINLKKIFNI